VCVWCENEIKNSSDLYKMYLRHHFVEIMELFFKFFDGRVASSLNQEDTVISSCLLEWVFVITWL